MGETEERSERGTEESPERMMPYHRALPAEPQSKLYLGCLNKPQLILISVAAGLVPLIIIITVAAVLPTKSDSSTALPSFSTGGDMLDFLVQSGDISSPDGLMATWYHRANSKEEMNKALTSDAMILEADITLEGCGTANENPIPIMAHPPDIYSDNTLDQWMDAVLASRKGMKLDFKTLRSVGLSLDLLSQKSKNSSRGINRPVWVNADILLGPNAPAFLPAVNGTSFLQLVQEKFPNVTLSPGWKVEPPLFVETYTETMVKDMYDMIKDVPQKVTFPVHALLGRSGWQHISWLLSQSSRFSLTLWQGSTHPNISDLLFIRENSHPARVYYDIYEPTLSAFRQAASQQGLLRRFYPGGDLMDFLYPNQNSDFLSTAPRRSSLDVRWVRVTDRTSLLETLSGGDGGMLVVQVVSDSNRPGVPLVEGSEKSSEALTLEDLLELLGQKAEAPWGVYLRIHSQQLLEASLTRLHSAYSQEKLYRPVWVSREGPLSPDHNQAYYLITSSAQRTFNTSSTGDGASEPGEYSNNNKDPFEDSCLGLAARTSTCACTQVKIYRGSRAFSRAITKDQRTSITTAASTSICACHKIKIHLGTKASTTAITINPASKEVSPSTPPSLRHSHQQPMHHHPHRHSSQTHCLGRQTKTMALLPLSLHL